MTMHCNSRADNPMFPAYFYQNNHDIVMFYFRPTNHQMKKQNHLRILHRRPQDLQSKQIFVIGFSNVVMLHANIHIVCTSVAKSPLFLIRLFRSSVLALTCLSSYRHLYIRLPQFLHYMDVYHKWRKPVKYTDILH